MNNNKKIYTILSNGIKKEYNVVLTFYNEETNKNYIIYTDDTLDKNNKVRLYAGIYDPNLNYKYIGEPTTKEEWTHINDILNKIIIKK